MADGTAGSAAPASTISPSPSPRPKRYSYAFDGRNQAIDHIIVNDLMAGIATYDVVHINTGYNPLAPAPTPIRRCRINDPAVSSYDFRRAGRDADRDRGADAIDVPRRQRRHLRLGGADTLFGGNGNDYVDGGDATTCSPAVDGTDFIVGGNGNDYIDGGAGDELIVRASADGLYPAVPHNWLASSLP